MCEICLAQGRVWVRGMGLGFTNPVRTWVLGCGGLGGWGGVISGFFV